MTAHPYIGCTSGNLATSCPECRKIRGNYPDLFTEEAPTKNAEDYANLVMPTCPECGNEVEVRAGGRMFRKGLVCYTCHVVWDIDGTDPWED